MGNPALSLPPVILILPLIPMGFASITWPILSPTMKDDFGSLSSNLTAFLVFGSDRMT